LCVDATHLLVLEDVAIEDRPLLDRGHFRGKGSVIRRARFDAGLEISRASGTLTIEDSWMFGNAVSSGLSDSSGSDPFKLTIIRSTLSGAARGIDLAANIKLKVLDSTISGNIGSGIEGSDEVRITIENSTIVDNGGATATTNVRGVRSPRIPAKVRASIIAGNLNAAGAADCDNLHSRGFNIVGSAAGCEIQGSAAMTVVGVDPLIGPFQDNGGFG
jgi:hypothetical protein